MWIELTRSARKGPRGSAPWQVWGSAPEPKSKMQLKLFDHSSCHLCARAEKRVIQYFYRASELLRIKFYRSSGECCTLAVSLYVLQRLYSHRSSDLRNLVYYKVRCLLILGFESPKFSETKKKQRVHLV
ncbi:unnamed protein product [Camellia sinensis]